MTKQVNKAKRPARLDITDMPRDEKRALGGLRKALCASFNYCRKYPTKMKTLKSVIRYTYERIVAWEKEYDAHQIQVQKDTLELQARKEGIELDARKTLENMQKDFEKAQAAAAKE